MILDYLISYIVWFLIFETFFLLVRGFTLLWDNILLPILLFVLFVLMMREILFYFNIIIDNDLLNSQNDIIQILSIYFIILGIFLIRFLYYLIFGKGKKPNKKYKQTWWYSLWNPKYVEPSEEVFELKGTERWLRSLFPSLFAAYICIPLALILPIWTLDLVSEILSIVYENSFLLNDSFHNETSHNRLQSLL